MNSKFSKIFSILIVLTLIIGMVGCSSPSKEEVNKDVVKVGFVADQAFDQSEWLINLVNGINQYTKDNTNVEVNMVEATTASEFEPKIRALAEAGYDIIITTYAAMAESTINVAKDFPDIKFGSLDGSIDNIEKYENLEEFGLSRTETGYLAGVAAAATSKSGIVGIVGGMDEPVINAIIAGWQQGLISVNPDITDFVSYAGTWTDSTTGKDLGLALVERGADVIAAAAGGTGAGTAQAAAETNTFYVSWDTHYDEIFENNNVELGSAVNYFDKMVIKFIQDAIDGKFKAGQRVEYGLSDGVVDFDIYEDSPISKEARDLVADALKKIQNNEIEISPIPLHK